MGLDASLLLNALGRVHIYKYGVFVADIGSYAEGDVLRIAVSAAGEAIYYRNDVEIHRLSDVLNAGHFPLYVRAAMDTFAGTFTDVRVCLPPVPSATDDAVAAVEDETLLLPAPGVLGNDGFHPSLVATVLNPTVAAAAGVTLGSDGSVSISEPAPEFAGTISINYQISSDQFSIANTDASITITVAAVNDPPGLSVPSHFLFTPIDTPLDLAPYLSLNDPDDGDTVTLNEAAAPANGGLDVTAMQYSPNAGFEGIESFQIQAEDAEGALSGIATIQVVVGQPGATEQNLVAAGIDAYDRFGFRLAVGDSHAIVGSDQDDTHGENAGRAWLFQLDPRGVWLDAGELAQPNAASHDGFGLAVAMAGELAVVAAPFADNAGQPNVGKVFVYRRNPIYDTDPTVSPYALEATLIPETNTAYEIFGISVATDGEQVIVGRLENGSNADFAAGKIRVFRAAANPDNSDGAPAFLWSADGPITHPDAPRATFFGQSVAIDGNWAAVGAHKDDLLREDGGAVFLFNFDGSTWTYSKTLNYGTASDSHHFGASVAMQGGNLAVGAPGDCTDAYAAGAAWLYLGDRADAESPVTDYLLSARLAADDAGSRDYGGEAVSISGDQVALGAREHDLRGNQSGAAYIFDISSLTASPPPVTPSTLSHSRSFTPDDLAAGDYFGRAVAIHGDYVVAGAHGSDTYGTDAGNAWFFYLGEANLPPTAVHIVDSEGADIDLAVSEHHSTTLALGTIVAADANLDDTHIFEILTQSPDGAFEIRDDNQLHFTYDTLNYEDLAVARNFSL
ncbi:MAG: hypothetical protein ACI8W8_003271 [Rhodothermales bacterium]